MKKTLTNNKKMWLKKVWDFMWNSNSIWSWIVDIVLMFLIVKFVLLPLCGLILATSTPLMIIESGSMTHEGNLDSWFSVHGQWYLDNNITKAEIEKWPWHNGLYKGDIMIIKGLKNYDYKKGDVIVFRVQNQGTPIIHRLIDIKTDENNETIFMTKGDHNDGQLPYELNIKKEQLHGKAVVQIPKLGWVKLFFVELFR